MDLSNAQIGGARTNSTASSPLIYQLAINIELETIPVVDSSYVMSARQRWFIGANAEAAALRIHQKARARQRCT